MESQQKKDRNGYARISQRKPLAIKRRSVGGRRGFLQMYQKSRARLKRTSDKAVEGGRWGGKEEAVKGREICRG